MTRVLTTLVLVVVASTMAFAQQRDTRPVAPSTTAPPAPTGTAKVSGQVVADGGGTALAHAVVVLIGARTGVIKVTSTDRDGRFTFDALPADRYNVGASKLPYLGAVAGARRPVRPGVAVIVADKAHVPDVVIRLPLGAAISGTIFDLSGNPATNTMVSVLQRKTQNGEVIISGVAGGTVQTDDRGRYRVHSLAPGEYLVTASPSAIGIGVGLSRRLSDDDVDAVLSGRVTPEPVGPAPPFRNSSSYFPGTARVADAGTVLVAAGDDRTGVDFRLESPSQSSIEGIVSTADGSPLPPRTTVMLTTVAGSSPFSSGASITVGPDGRFGIAGQAPGRYALNARVGTGPTALAALAVVEALGNDVVSAQLVLRPPVTLTGRLTTVPGATTKPPSFTGLRLPLTGLSAATRTGFVPQVTAAATDGTFTIAGVMPGRYTFGGAPFFGASGDSVTWGLDTVVIDGTDVTDRAFDVSAETPPKEIVATLTDQWQQIAGRVTNTAGAGVSDYTMLVFPVDEAYWLHNSRRIVTTQPAGDGHYQLGGPGPALLPAGEYYLAAVTDVSKDEQYDPAFLKALLPAAIKITLGTGERKTQDVRVQ
jgi:Carboxypeptidase regulatory-like domain